MRMRGKFMKIVEMVIVVLLTSIVWGGGFYVGTQYERALLLCEVCPGRN